MSQAYHYIIRLNNAISSRSRVRGRLDHCFCTQFVLGGFKKSGLPMGVYAI